MPSNNQIENGQFAKLQELSQTRVTRRLFLKGAGSLTLTQTLERGLLLLDKLFPQSPVDQHQEPEATSSVSATSQTGYEAKITPSDFTHFVWERYENQERSYRRRDYCWLGGDDSREEDPSFESHLTGIFEFKLPDAFRDNASGRIRLSVQDVCRRVPRGKLRAEVLFPDPNVYLSKIDYADAHQLQPEFSMGEVDFGTWSESDTRDNWQPHLFEVPRDHTDRFIREDRAWIRLSLEPPEGEDAILAVATGYRDTEDPKYPYLTHPLNEVPPTLTIDQKPLFGVWPYLTGENPEISLNGRDWTDLSTLEENPLPQSRYFLRLAEDETGSPVNQIADKVLMEINGQTSQVYIRPEQMVPLSFPSFPTGRPEIESFNVYGMIGLRNSRQLRPDRTVSSRKQKEQDLSSDKNTTPPQPERIVFDQITPPVFLGDYAVFNAETADGRQTTVTVPIESAIAGVRDEFPGFIGGGGGTGGAGGIGGIAVFALAGAALAAFNEWRDNFKTSLPDNWRHRIQPYILGTLEALIPDNIEHTVSWWGENGRQVSPLDALEELITSFPADEMEADLHLMSAESFQPWTKGPGQLQPKKWRWENHPKNHWEKHLPGGERHDPIPVTHEALDQIKTDLKVRSPRQMSAVNVCTSYLMNAAEIDVEYNGADIKVVAISWFTLNHYGYLRHITTYVPSQNRTVRAQEGKFGARVTPASVGWAKAEKMLAYERLAWVHRQAQEIFSYERQYDYLIPRQETGYCAE